MARDHRQRPGSGRTRVASRSRRRRSIWCLLSLASALRIGTARPARRSGLTRGSTRKEIARAALESVGYQTRDLIDAMQADAERSLAGDRIRHSRRRRHERQRLDDAIPRRHAQRAGRSAEILKRPRSAPATSRAGRRGSTRADEFAKTWRRQSDASSPTMAASEREVPLSRLARRRRPHGLRAGDLD